MREQHDPSAAGQPVQATLRQRTRVLGGQAPVAPPGEADRQLEQPRGAVGKGHGAQRMRLLPTLVQRAQRPERLQERAHEDEARAPHDPPRETIDRRLVSLARPPKAVSPAPPAERPDAWRGAGPSLSRRRLASGWRGGAVTMDAVPSQEGLPNLPMMPCPTVVVVNHTGAW